MSQLSICIKRRLDSLSSTSFEPFIFKINEQLRIENRKAYEPEILSIGPYHRGKVNLQMMEEYKLQYLHELLKGRNESVDKYIEAMKNLEEEARKSYGEPIKLNKDKFAEMMLLDGCFIIELFRKSMDPNLRDVHCPIFKIPKILRSIQRDLQLFENQIPLSVLIKLFEMTEYSNQMPPQNILVEWALKFFGAGTISTSLQTPKYHLLGLLQDALYSSIPKKEPSPGTDTSQEFIKSVTELRTAGIKFKTRTGYLSLDVEFENGIMKIPPLSIHDDTEWIFRNMIAYEQYSGGTVKPYMTEYTKFMDCLINSPKDVEILRHSGIIENWLGDDKVVSTIFNKISNHIEIDIYSEKFYYREVFTKVNKFCKHRRHGWMAFLRYNYCNSPWSILSVLVASVFLLLTVIQTVCSILQVKF